MRYDKLLDAITLNISELCGTVDDDEKKRLCDIAGLTQVAFRTSYSRDDITYTLIGTAYALNDCICDVVLTADPTAQLPSPTEHTLLSAFLFCLHNDAASANISVIGVSEDGTVNSSQTVSRTRDALEKYFVRRLDRCAGVAKMLQKRSKEILPSAAAVKFPYPSLRRGQRLMMHECYDSMCRGERLFVQAPTGIGKTISALYPAVKFLGQGKCDKIFYATAKSSTQNEAYKAAGALFRGGAMLRTVVISAKEQICTRREHMTAGMCDVRRCRCASASDEALMSGVFELLALQNGFERGIIRHVAGKWGVCPYELSLKLAEYCEIIIADYNYIFDPLVFLRRFFGEPGDGSRYILLIDEAHNLADRARDMYSAELCRGDITALRSAVADMLPELTAMLDAFLGDFDTIRKLCAENTEKSGDGTEHGYYISRERDMLFDSHAQLVCRELGKRLRAGSDQPGYAAMAGLYRRLRRYIVSGELCGERSMLYCQLDGAQITVRSLCIDPSAILDGKMRRFRSTVLFSATLTPPDYFNDLLGGGRGAVNLALRSPYDEENLFLGAVSDISTRFEDREKSLSRIVSYIAATLSAKRGNYMVYFPSYEYMQSAAELFGKRFPAVRLLTQTRGMSRDEREDFLSEFRRGDGAMRVGFCVLGGSFSEGIDLAGQCLIGAIVIGVGIPGISGERNIMRDYFQLTRESGYDYAYTYPGMNNVLQAAGRVIRSDTDRGVVVLIDDRYASEQYRSMYPEHWRGMKYFNAPASLNAAISDFWRKNESKNADNNK